MWIIFTTEVAKAATVSWANTLNLNRLRDYFVIIFRCALFTEEVGEFFNITIGSISTLDTARLTHHLGSQHQHITFTEQLLGPTHIKHNARVGIIIYGEGDTTWNVGLDQTGNHFNLRTLGCKHEMNTRGTTFLCDTNNQLFKVFPCLHHQVSHLINHDNDVWHLAAIMLLFIIILIGDGGGFFMKLFIVVFNFLNLLFGHKSISALHLINSPFHGGK